jgi:hypothetical protein
MSKHIKTLTKRSISVSQLKYFNHPIKGIQIEITSAGHDIYGDCKITISGATPATLNGTYDITAYNTSIIRTSQYISLIDNGSNPGIATGTIIGNLELLSFDLLIADSGERSFERLVPEGANFGANNAVICTQAIDLMHDNVTEIITYYNKPGTTTKEVINSAGAGIIYAQHKAKTKIRIIVKSGDATSVFDPVVFDFNIPVIINV